MLKEAPPQKKNTKKPKQHIYVSRRYRFRSSKNVRLLVIKSDKRKWRNVVRIIHVSRSEVICGMVVSCFKKK